MEAGETGRVEYGTGIQLRIVRAKMKVVNSFVDLVDTPENDWKDDWKDESGIPFSITMLVHLCEEHYQDQSNNDSWKVVSDFRKKLVAEYGENQVYDWVREYWRRIPLPVK